MGSNKTVETMAGGRMGYRWPILSATTDSIPTFIYKEDYRFMATSNDSNAWAWVKGVMGRLRAYFTSDAALRDLERAASISRAALPVVDVIAQVAVKMTPTGVDDDALAWCEKVAPRLFDGSLTTNAEFESYARSAVFLFLKQRFPVDKNRILNAAVEMAVIAVKASGH